MSKASDYFVKTIEKLSLVGDPLCICEVGADKGDTIKRVEPFLESSDRYYFFDYASKVKNIKQTIVNPSFMLIGLGNTRKTYDSYAWSLFELFKKLKSVGSPTEIFDVVFLDASNIFLHDLSACSILEKMIKPNGIIILNNTQWTFESSKYWNPTNNPETEKMLTPTQIQTPMVSAVCDILFESKYWEDISPETNFKVYLRK